MCSFLSSCDEYRQGCLFLSAAWEKLGEGRELMACCLLKFSQLANNSCPKRDPEIPCPEVTASALQMLQPPARNIFISLILSITSCQVHPGGYCHANEAAQETQFSCSFERHSHHAPVLQFIQAQLNCLLRIKDRALIKYRTLFPITTWLLCQLASLLRWNAQTSYTSFTLRGIAVRASPAGMKF